MSTIQAANISNGTDTVATGYVVNGSAKALCNYSQESTPIVVRSLNVSSVTDDSTAVATVNMTSAFSAADYLITSGIRDGGGRNDAMILTAATADTYTTNAYQYHTLSYTTLNDSIGFTTYFGDLA